MRLIEVKTAADEKQFLDLARNLYKDDPEWICPLDQDIRNIFDPQKSFFFRDGEARRWLMFNDRNEPTGRIAAFYNKKLFRENDRSLGGMGFFESINDINVAFQLFDAARTWLSSKGLEGADAPVNFGEKDKFWGLMVEGFKQPSYQENYNPPYYRDFFEAYGFVKTTEQTTSEVSMERFDYERFKRISSRVLSNPDYHFENYKHREVKRFAADFISIYNQAWANRKDFVPMTMDRIETTLQSLKPILVEELIWFAYAHGEPAGFYINVIDVNQIFRHLNGKLDLIGKLKFLWFRRFGDVSRVRGIVFGVIPKYQNLGLEAGMIMKFYEAVKKFPKLKTSELAWIGDFNPKMHSLFKALGAQTSKVHYTYRLMF